MPESITRADLVARHDFEASQAAVLGALRAAFTTREGRLRFMGRYAAWNRQFGSGVASLAGRIGRSYPLFVDPEQRIAAVADRSVYVASYFFDAARDEFDDRDTVHRDTHRCLAQSVLQGLMDYDAASGAPWSPEEANALLAEPGWLLSLIRRVADGYGAHGEETPEVLFSAVGYHLGSEVLADQEFSLIDAELQASDPGLIRWLSGHQVQIAGQAHSAWTWIRIHSGHGGGAEADHFDWALQGVERALRYATTDRQRARQHVLAGFDAFAADHDTFFRQVNG